MLTGTASRGALRKISFPQDLGERGGLGKQDTVQKDGEGGGLDDPGCLEVKVQWHEAAEIQTQLKQLSKAQGRRAGPSRWPLTPFAGCADEPIPGTPALEAQGVKVTELEAWLASGLCGCTRSLLVVTALSVSAWPQD